MNRYQMNLIKKKRKRFFVLALVFCISFFVCGVIITNNTMARMLVLPDEKNILSIRHVSGFFEKIRSFLLR